MKTPRFLKNTLGLAVLTLAISVSSSTFAGPGPQFWQQKAAEAKARDDSKQAATAPAKPNPASAMACPHCQTASMTKTTWTNVSGKTAPHGRVVGQQHTCAGCAGGITNSNGKLTDEMKRTCPMCAKVPTCCKVTT